MVAGASPGVNTSLCCDGDNILKIVSACVLHSPGNPVPSSSADGLGQGEVQMEEKG